MTENEIMNMSESQWKNLYTSGQCSTCIYKIWIFYAGKNGKSCCGYCYRTGHMRKSLPPNCNKYQKAETRRKKHKGGFSNEK